MRYLFFDLEYASQKHGKSKICEFGYVITNERFEIINRNNLIINPAIQNNEWDYWALKNVLTRTKEEYLSNPTFPHYYDRIRYLLLSADYVIGHTLNCDAKALNDDCKRYVKPSLDYVFYDVKKIYKDYSNTDNDTSVENILKQLDVKGEDTIHDAESDAYNTMLGLKSMLDSLNVTFEDMIKLCPKSKDETNNYIVKSIDESKNKSEREFNERLQGDGTNTIKKYGINRKRFLQFLDNVKPNKKGMGKFKNKKISISINYEEHHFRQMLNIIQMIVNEGGCFVLKALESNIFVKYDILLEDGTNKADSRYNYVLQANNNGANIEIISFTDFLKQLEITEEQLDALEPINFDFLFEEGAIIKDKREKRIIENIKRKQEYIIDTSGSKIGDILAFKKIF